MTTLNSGNNTWFYYHEVANEGEFSVRPEAIPNPCPLRGRREPRNTGSAAPKLAKHVRAGQVRREFVSARMSAGRRQDLIHHPHSSKSGAQSAAHSDDRYIPRGWRWHYRAYHSGREQRVKTILEDRARSSPEAALCGRAQSRHEREDHQCWPPTITAATPRGST